MFGSFGWMELVLILIIAHAVSVVAMLIILFVGDTSRMVDPGIGGPQPVSRVLWGAIALDGVIMIFLLLLYLPANRALSSVAWPPSRARSKNARISLA